MDTWTQSLEENLTYHLAPWGETERQAVIDIFNCFIENSFAAYPDTKMPYAAYDRFLQMAAGCPSAVVKAASGQTIGFGFLHPYHPAGTFRRTLEISYFILPEHTGRGLGTRLLDRFTEEARQMDVKMLVASISSRNEQSLAFHRKHGFVEAGRLRDVGQKFGEIFDVVWMQKEIKLA